jgi:hypothetical protein
VELQVKEEVNKSALTNQDSALSQPRRRFPDSVIGFFFTAMLQIRRPVLCRLPARLSRATAVAAPSCEWKRISIFYPTAEPDFLSCLIDLDKSLLQSIYSKPQNIQQLYDSIFPHPAADGGFFPA